MPAEVLDRFDNPEGQPVVELVLGEDREIFLTIGGEKAFQTGSWICDTCRYIFTKVVGAQGLTDGTTDQFAERLSRDLCDIATMPDQRSLREFASVLAPGAYSVRAYQPYSADGDARW